MNFDFLKNISSSETDNENFAEIRRLCIHAEENVRTKPMTTLTSARSALEAILKFYMHQNAISASGGSLNDIVAACAESCEELEQMREEMDAVRKEGNKMVHGNKNPEYTLKVTDSNLVLSMQIIEKLYKVLSVLFDHDEPFDSDKVPFDKYEIVRKVHKYAGEIVCDEYNYFTKVSGSDGETDEYYYLQCYPLDVLNELNSRRQEAVNEISSKKTGRSSYLLNPIRGLKLPEGSNRSIVVYKVWDDSYVLSEIENNNFPKMNVKQALEVGLDIVNNLIELKKFKIHHRNVCPGCILINPLDNSELEAYLINMHTSKIIYSDKTVVSKLSNVVKSSFFAPRILRNASTKLENFSNWEAVDVYGVGKIILYCLDTALSTVDSIDELCAKNSFGLSETILDLYENLFFDDIDFTDIPKLEEMKVLLENEIEELQN